MILCGGENLMDLLPEAPDPEATPDRALRYRAVAGGAPCNCARALARLGTPAAYLAPVSTDAFGAALAEGLSRDGVVLAGGRSDLPTALALVTLGADGPSYAFHREGTADRDVTPAGLLEALSGDAVALCLSGMALADGPDADAWVSLGVAASARGLVVVVDPNIRPAALPADPGPFRARLARLCAVADLVKLSSQDAAWLAPGRDDVGVAEAFLASGAGLVVLTRGAGGAMALSPLRWVERPAAPVDGLVDTVGAGDAFLAAFLDGARRLGALVPGGLGSLTEETLEALLDRAARAAALCCARPGCDPPHARDLG